MLARMAWPLLIALTVPVTALLLWLHVPAALMLGPLLAGIVFASWGGQVRFPVSIFAVAQGIVGCLIAKMVPLSIVGDILGHWVLFTTGVVSVLVASCGLGWLMTRWQMLPGTTALWGISPGAASVMTFMAEAYGADIRLVALMQYLRIFLVAGIAALVARLFGVSSSYGAAAIVWFPEVHALPLAETLALAIVGPAIAWVARIPAGAFLVPMVAGIVLAHLGWMTIELPAWLLAASYALVGWNIGLRFTRPLLVHAARALPRIVACTLILIAICGGIAALFVLVADVDPLTAYLATSPGGSDSIAIIAASTDCDVSFVMAMQTVRMIAVLLLAPALTTFIARRIKVPPNG
ncbi:MAG: ammonia monooxygenase [Alphaproteobacteria bacterium RIFCSPHIGHO2_12_FULL_66_14]|jgi:membrane AbrB-like protein|nr:MAG: ammonia monooxygenase [Alphaproteobacteria bacterium RIFCSPHIGHO2_12_FULL_66_14]